VAVRYYQAPTGTISHVLAEIDIHSHDGVSPLTEVTERAPMLALMRTAFSRRPQHFLNDYVNDGARDGDQDAVSTCPTQLPNMNSFYANVGIRIVGMKPIAFGNWDGVYVAELLLIGSRYTCD
jgi:hypothetical protein